MPGVLLFVKRRADKSPREFRDHFEGTHIPLIKSLIGDAFPPSHVRRYLARSPDAPHDAVVPPVPDLDVAQTVEFATGFDVVLQVSWETEEQMGVTIAALQGEETHRKVAADEEEFIDRTATRFLIVGETCEG